MSELKISRVFYGNSEGALSINATSIQWRSSATESMKRISKDDIQNLTWSPLGPTCLFTVTLLNENIIRFHGITQDHIKDIKALVTETFNLSLKEDSVCSKGGNWGTFAVEGDALQFQVNDSGIFDISYANISQCAVPSKNEVELQFHEDDTVSGDQETLVEMRLYVPPGEEPDAESFKEEVIQRANISMVTGKKIVDLDETVGTFLTPRGRYAIEMYQKFFRMHGKTYDYKIMYSNINRCFLLERPDGISSAFVISLEEPIRQGKQGYPHLVLQLKKNEAEIEVNLPENELKAYEGHLSERMAGQLPQLVATLFKYLVKKKVYTSGKFTTHNGDRAVKCALKAQEGLLYPLEKSFMFIHKPTNFIRYEDVHYVEFQRYAGTTGANASRNFDLLVKCKNITGGDQAQEFIFSAIDRREFPELSKFLNSKKMKVRNLKETHEPAAPNVMQSLGPEDGEIDESEEDSDFGPGGSASSSNASSEESDAAEDSGDDDDDEEEKTDSKRKSSKESSGTKKKKSKSSSVKSEE